jgi:hypothetical protein
MNALPPHDDKTQRGAGFDSQCQETSLYAVIKMHGKGRGGGLMNIATVAACACLRNGRCSSM